MKIKIKIKIKIIKIKIIIIQIPVLQIFLTAFISEITSRSELNAEGENLTVPSGKVPRVLWDNAAQ